MRTVIQSMLFAAFMVVLTSGFVFAVVTFIGRQRLRELAIKERIAMIEKGLAPSPELDPARFDALFAAPGLNPRGLRYRTAGLLILGFGLALAMLLFFTVPRETRGIAVGVGGAIALIGLTALGNGLLILNDPGPREERPR